MAPPGILYIVSTPIGNLNDLTQRAIDVLSSVDLILSEDTRQTHKMLEKYNISKSQISYRDQNHVKAFPSILENLKKGMNLALVSDSGTPIISDPGFKLLQELIKEGIEIKSIPGPSAVTSALSISGLPTDKFSFLGFLPKGTSARKNLLAKYGVLDATIVIFESPFRIQKLLGEILDTMGNRYICICRELTKVHETCYRGRISDVLELKITLKGEFVVLVSKEGFSIGV